jgi:hypothetical protein
MDQPSRLMRRLMMSNWFPNSLTHSIVRRAVRATSNRIPCSPQLLVDTMAVDRPQYAYCLLGAAKQAQLLGESRISAIEFGVAGGNGLAFMCSFAERIKTATGVTIDCYGFDTGEGMPDPKAQKICITGSSRVNTGWTRQSCARVSRMPISR